MGFEHLRETNFGVAAGNFFRSRRSPSGRRIQWLPIELPFSPCVVYVLCTKAGLSFFGVATNFKFFRFLFTRKAIGWSDLGKGMGAVGLERARCGGRGRLVGGGSWVLRWVR